MRASLFGVALGLGLAGCTLADAAPRIAPAAAFPRDKGAAELKRAYPAMTALFAQRNPDWEVASIAGDQSEWGVLHGPTGNPARREARVFVGLRSKDGDGRCQIVVTSFGEENQGGPAWGEPYISEYGIPLGPKPEPASNGPVNPTSLRKAGDFENPFPIACDLLTGNPSDVRKGQLDGSFRRALRSGG